MSEHGQGQERTEQPTPKRLSRAREEGQVPQSRDLNAMIVTLAGALACWILGGQIINGLSDLLTAGLSPAIPGELENGRVFEGLADGIVDGLALLAPLLAVLCAAAVLGPAFLGGVVLNANACRPKLSRLSPMQGLSRIFSSHGLVELVKTLLKFVVLSVGGIVLLFSLTDELIALGTGSPRAGIVATAEIVRRAFLILTAGLVLIAAVDVPFQLWSHRRRLRMTRQDVKDELKESEGNPEMRARVRRVQRETARRRMMDAIPHADIVVTNPVRFAVALRYTDRPERAPRVVAKGRALTAARIRELAEAHAVPVCAAPDLARAIYFNAEVGEEIPRGLYVAVARLLAWVMRLKAARNAGAELPAFPQELPVPPDLLRRYERLAQ